MKHCERKVVRSSFAIQYTQCVDLKSAVSNLTYLEGFAHHKRCIALPAIYCEPSELPLRSSDFPKGLEVNTEQ